MEEPKVATLNFSNLPLAEVALRMSFVESINLSLTNVIELSNRLNIDSNQVHLSKVGNSAPGYSVSEIRKDGDATFVIEDEKSAILTMLHNRFLCVVWVGKVDDSCPYPRFSEMKSRFKQSTALLMRILGLPNFNVHAVNMGYTNFVLNPPNLEISSTIPLTKVMVGGNAVKKGSRMTEFNMAWSEDSMLDIRLLIQKAKIHMGDVDEDGLALTTTAGKLIEGEVSLALSGVDDCHDRLQILFKEIISDQQLQEFGLQK